MKIVNIFNEKRRLYLGLILIIAACLMKLLNPNISNSFEIIWYIILLTGIALTTYWLIKNAKK